MSVNEVIKLYPGIVAVLKEAGVVHRSQIEMIIVDRKTKTHNLHFIGDHEYQTNSGGFDVFIECVTIKVRCDFDGNKIVKPTYEVEFIED